MILLIMALLAVAPSASASPSPGDQARTNYERAQQLYVQSCADRAYGAYDDLCEELKTQVRDYRVQLDRAERTAAKPVKASTSAGP